MSSDIEEFDEQILDLLDSVQKTLISELGRLKGQERTEKCSYLRNRLNRARQLHRSIVVEIRDLPPDQAANWEPKAKAYDVRIGKLTQDLEWAETSSARDPGPNVSPSKKGFEQMTAKEVTQFAIKVQDKTQESTARSKRAVEETLDIGAAVQEELRRQGETIEKIQQDVEELESHLKRADKQMRIFLRRMASDKSVMLFIFLIVLALSIGIAFFVLKKTCPTSVEKLLSCKAESPANPTVTT